MELDLKDKVAVISGGSAGIGLAVAEGLAQEGVHLALCSRNEKQVASKAKALGKKYGVKAIGVGVDVSRADEIVTFVSQVSEEYGGADILINNAGTGIIEKIMTASDEMWQYFWDLHVMAAVRLSRGLIPFMRQRGGGVIINNASICAKQPLEYSPIYAVTKAALMMFSKVLSNEVIADNIRVNCINPGLIMTPDWVKSAQKLTKNTGGRWEDFLDETAKNNTPIGRFASTEELANFFVFLSSPRASYCVGSTYYVDGGWLKVVA